MLPHLKRAVTLNYFLDIQREVAARVINDDRTRAAWLKSLKEDDEVAVRRGLGGSARYEIVRVAHTTGRKIVINETLRFWRESGQIIGPSDGPIEMVEATEKVRGQAAETLGRERRRRELCLSKLREVAWERLDTSALEEIVKHIPEHA